MKKNFKSILKRVALVMFCLCMITQSMGATVFAIESNVTDIVAETGANNGGAPADSSADKAGTGDDAGVGAISTDTAEIVGLTIADIDVTSANADDIFASDPENAGKASFDPDTNTLYFNGVNINASGMAFIVITGIDITVEFSGVNTISGFTIGVTAAADGGVGGSVEFVGKTADSVLNLTANAFGIGAVNASFGGNGTVNLLVTSSMDSSAVGISAENEITFKDQITVNIDITDESALLKMALVAMSSINSSAFTILDKGGNELYCYAAQGTYALFTVPESELPDSEEYITYMAGNAVIKPDAHTHPVCGDSACGDHGTDIIYTPLTQEFIYSLIPDSSKRRFIPEGNYYLTENIVTEGSSLMITGNTVICLNGYTFDTGTYSLRADSGATLKLCDCGTGGEVTGKNGSFQAQGGTFYIYGGTYTGAVSIYFSAEAHIYGGTYNNPIIANSGTIYFAGAPVFTGYGENIQVNKNVKIYVAEKENSDVKFTGTLKLWINSIASTVGTAFVYGVDDTNEGNFTLSNSGYFLKRGSGANADKLLVSAPHKHSGVDGEFAELTDFSQLTVSGKYYLDSNIPTAVDNITIPAGVEITLCLNGKTLDLGEYRIYVEAGATLNICDCTGGGVITSAYSVAFSDRGTIYNIGTLNVDGVSIKNTSEAYSAAIWNASSGVAQVNNSTVISVNGMAIYNHGSDSTLSVTSSTASGYMDSNEGAGIWAYGRVTVTDSTISGYRAITSNSQTAVINITNSNLTGKNYGMEIANEGCTVTVTGGSITSTNGNAIYNYRANITLKGDVKLDGAKADIYLSIFDNDDTGFPVLDVSDLTNPENDTFSITVVSYYSVGSPILTGGLDKAEWFTVERAGMQYVLLEGTGEYAGKLVLHKHTYTTERDNTNHWEECSCGDIKNVQPHTFTNNTCSCGLHSHDGVIFDSKIAFTTISGTAVFMSANYILNSNITVTEGGLMKVRAGEVVRICLNGHTIDLGTSAFIIEEGATLIICDCHGTGTITSANSDPSEGTIVNNGGTLTILGGNITNTATAEDYATAIHNFGNATVIASGGNVSGIYGFLSESSTEIYVSGTAEIYGITAAITGGKTIEVSGGRVVSEQYGIYVSGSHNMTITISGGAVIGQSVSGLSGSGIYNSNHNATITVSGGYIAGAGYGLYNYGDNAVINITGGEVVGTGDGNYGIYTYKNGATITVSGGTVLCTAGMGYGIFNYSSTVIITGGKVQGSYCGIDNNYMLTVTGGEIIGNGYENYGTTGIFNKGTLTVSGGYIFGNDRAIYNYNNSVSLTYTATIGGDVEIESNGTAIDNHGTLHISSGTITAAKVGIATVGKYAYTYLSGAPVFDVVSYDLQMSTSNNFYAENADGTSAYTGESLLVNVESADKQINNIVINNVITEGDNANIDKFVITNYNYLLVEHEADLYLHYHEWSEDWTSDGTHHWHECVNNYCPIENDSEKDSYAEHTALDDDGSCLTAVFCSVCNYVAIEGRDDHSYVYTASGDVIYESCGIAGCTTHKATATITAPAGDIIYNGTEFAATVTYSDNWAGEKPSVTYTRGGEATSDLVGAGTISAAFTVGGATASVTYTIGKAAQSAPEGVGAVDTTFIDTVNGKISGTAPGMEYKPSSEAEWIYIYGYEVVNLPSGTYYVRYAENENYLASDYVTVTINKGGKRTAAITGITDIGKVYDGEAVVLPTYTYTGDGEIIIKWYTDIGGVKGEEISVPTNAGTYWVGVSANEGEIYNAVVETARQFVIEKAQAVITVDTAPIVVTYGDTITLPVASANLGTPTANLTVADMAAAGTYTVVYTVADNENYHGASASISVTVNKQKVAFPEACDTKFIYSGEAQTYKIADSALYTVSGDVRTDVGIYDVTISLADKANYEWADGSIENVIFKFAIEKAQAEITLDTAPIVVTYGDIWTLPTASANFGTPKVSMSVADMADAGTYTVVYTVAESANYYGTSASVTVTVNKQKVQKPTPDMNGFVYNGNEQTYKVASSALYYVSGTKRTDAGSQNVIVVLKDTDNYEWADGSIANVIFKFTIEKAQAQISVNVTSIEGIYGGVLTLPDVSSNFGTPVANLTAADMANAGSYTLIYAVEDTENYYGASISIPVVIYKARLDLSGITFADKTVKENGEAHSIEIGGVLPEGVSVIYEGNGKTEAGIYVITATFVFDKANYEAVESMSAVLTINQSQIVDNIGDGEGTPDIIVSNDGGFENDVEIVITEIPTDKVNTGDALGKNDALVKAYDISLRGGGVDIQPDGNITIKLRIPDYLKDKAFRLVHNHNGTFTDIDYTIEDGYAVFTVDKLSEFLFIYNEAPSTGWIVWLVVAIVILAVGAGVVVYIEYEKKKKNGKK